MKPNQLKITLDYALYSSIIMEEITKGIKETQLVSEENGDFTYKMVTIPSNQSTTNMAVIS